MYDNKEMVALTTMLETNGVFPLTDATTELGWPRTEVEGIQGAGSQMGFMGLSPQNHLN
jgi:hypothetical protein